MPLQSKTEKFNHTPAKQGAQEQQQLYTRKIQRFEQEMNREKTA